MNENSFAKLGKVSRASILFLLWVAYVAAGKLGLELAFVNESASAVWAPAGIALAALLILGHRAWPAVFLGALAVNVSTTGMLWSSGAIAIGNTLEGVVGAYLIRRFAPGFRTLTRLNDVLNFALFGAVLSPMIAATIGASSLVFSGLAESSLLGSIWLTWWLGDAVGAAIVAPVLILWADRSRPGLSRLNWERILFVSSLVAVNLVVFTNGIPQLANRPIAYFLIPLFIWPAVRFKQTETSLGTLITSVIAVWGTLEGWGPFGNYPPSESLLLLQPFIGVVTMTGLALGAAVAENAEVREKLSHSYDAALEAWSQALDVRDREAEGHTRRVAEIAVKLAGALNMNEKEIVRMRRGALLHDIGKIAIPDHVLFKAGPLTSEEKEILENHPVYARELLHGTALEDSLDVPYSHHEKWDGTGYPQGLRGTDIPVAARIFAVADAWDTLRSSAPDRKALSADEAIERMDSLSGKQFDPDILRVFLRMAGGDKDLRG